MGTPIKKPAHSQSYSWALFTAVTTANLLYNRVYQYFFPLHPAPQVQETSREKLKKIPDPQSSSYISLGKIASFAATSVTKIAYEFWDSIPLSTKIFGGGAIAYIVWNRLQSKDQTSIKVANNNHINIHIQGIAPEKVEKSTEADGTTKINFIFSPEQS